VRCSDQADHVPEVFAKILILYEELFVALLVCPRLYGQQGGPVSVERSQNLSIDSHVNLCFLSAQALGSSSHRLRVAPAWERPQHVSPARVCRDRQSEVVDRDCGT